MLAGNAKEIARRWVTEHAAGMPAFAGAYLAGSINSLPDDADLPATSDVDVWVVLADQSTPDKLGKIMYRGALLDVAYVSRDRLRSPEAVLADYHVAGAFRTPNIISDPSGELTELQAAVSRDFAKRPWVMGRCEHARNHALGYVRSLREADAFPDQVLAWLFANGVMTHVLLVAGLRNPTVRRRYATVRELLGDYGELDLHDALLASLGCVEMNRECVERHLATLADAFDAAKGVAGAPFSFAGDITEIARPIAIDGSRELIDAGLHREAMFWIAVTYARCQKMLRYGGASRVADRCEADFREMLANLGITSPADLQRGAHRVEDLLPMVGRVAEGIIGANTEIGD